MFAVYKYTTQLNLHALQTSVSGKPSQADVKGNTCATNPHKSQSSSG